MPRTLQLTGIESMRTRPDALRRAMAFIQANPGRDLRVTQIAAASYVTARTLQLTFRRHLDTTPMAYLRTVRLARANLRLQAGAPDDGTTIARIALDSGFASPSRFSAQYRAAYGETPSATLREESAVEATGENGRGR